MRSQRLGVETKFLVPLREDRSLGFGCLHPVNRWTWLDTRLREKFGAISVSAALVRGAYTDTDTGELVEDESRQYAIAIKRREVGWLRRFLAQEVAPAFAQKCIYLVVGGEAELVCNEDI